MIPANVKTMGEKVFNGCSILHTVIFEKDSVLTAMNAGLFGDCAALKTVVIPGKVTQIRKAFAGVKAKDLTVYIVKTPEEIQKMIDDKKLLNVDNEAFRDVISNNTCYYYSEVKPTQEGNYWHYNEEGVPEKW